MIDLVFHEDSVVVGTWSQKIIVLLPGTLQGILDSPDGLYIVNCRVFPLIIDIFAIVETTFIS